MNTKIEYMYRDACNFKSFYSFVLAGELTKKERAIVHEGADFIPYEIGLPDLLPDDPDPDDDGPVHEIFSVTGTRNEPTFDTWATAKKFVEKFKKAPCDIEKAVKQLFGERDFNER